MYFYRFKPQKSFKVDKYWMLIDFFGNKILKCPNLMMKRTYGPVYRLLLWQSWLITLYYQCSCSVFTSMIKSFWYKISATIYAETGLYSKRTRGLPLQDYEKTFIFIFTPQIVASMTFVFKDTPKCGFQGQFLIKIEEFHFQKEILIYMQL